MDGLTGLSGLQTLYEDTPEGTPEEIHGGLANTKHEPGTQHAPFAYESQVVPGSDHLHRYGPMEAGIVDTSDPYAWILPAGTLEEDPTSERAPWTHAAPWPEDPIGDGSPDPDNTARKLEQSAAIHAMNPGGPLKRNTHSPTLYAQQDRWDEIWEVNPNSSDLTTVPAQIKSGAAPGGRGGTDRTQSNAHQNSFGFDSRHMHRRFAAGSVPGNYMWMKPGGRPLIKSLAGPARPAVGPDSYFHGDNLGDAFDTQGAILTGPATQYEPPATPYVAPAQPVATDAMDTSQFYGGY
jgi:hypothetical protein